ncbi:major facilitator superfamily domain-containing protein [Phaeosphaeriaceae sp. PMI808]|nr:major facilitator superfamily domain-containing protein [Phaeosphaeriaceae sp. PMI808]
MHPTPQPESVDDQSTWPPGTVTLEELRQTTEGAEDQFEIILIPTPTKDVNDPLNWKPWEKNLNIGLTLLYSLLVFALISAITPTWAPMTAELGFTVADLNNSYATGSAMLALGGLIFIPFALKYGRRPVYLLSLLGQFAVSIWSAKIKTTADLFLIQALNCLLGALAEVMVQMTIADVFFVHQRGLMNNLYVCTMSVGTSMSALVAGYITVGKGWRWVWWSFTIALGSSLVLFIFFYEETKFVPRIHGVPQANDSSSVVEGKIIEISDKKPGESDLKPMASNITAVATPRKSYLQRIKPVSESSGSLKELIHHVYQPLMVMCTIPAVAYVAILYGLITAAVQVSATLVASTMPAPPYNFTPSQIGLMSLPLFVGNILGTALSAPFTDRVILYLARKNRGIYEPEMRLWLLTVFLPFFPAGILLFGYALGKGMSWSLVAVGIGIASASMTPILSVALSYLTDAYTDIIADAVVGVTFIRNVLATVFVFVLTPWVARVQLHNVMLTFSMIFVVLVAGGTAGMITYGKRMRSATIKPYRLYAKRQVDSRA